MASLLSPVSGLLRRFSWRDVGHFVFAFVAALIAAIAQSGTSPSSTTAWVALAAGAGTVAFRQVFPSAGSWLTRLRAAYALMQTLQAPAPDPKTVIRITPPPYPPAVTPPAAVTVSAAPASFTVTESTVPGVLATPLGDVPLQPPTS